MTYEEALQALEKAQKATFWSQHIIDGITQTIKVFKRMKTHLEIYETSRDNLEQQLWENQKDKEN